jgi:pimeloyl-ACP methyl ester carboxylesterase
MKVYFISGLAADRRAFKHISLPEGFEAVYLDWITPLENELLPDYALRLAAGIDVYEPFALVGLSMGGMIASEIARQYVPMATILISSIPVASHLPTHFKWAGALQLHKLVPVRFVQSAAIMKRLFTTEAPEDKAMLKKMIIESDMDFIRWAMGAILKWKNEKQPSSYVHIHGTRDEVLPIRFTNPTHIIREAGHLMVMNRAQEINAILGATLTNALA